jgi:AcrR family transcriptional regulator
MTRRYDTSSRDAAARETRRRIIATAQDLLLEGGYRAMTIVSLAAAAGVSPQTVYNSVGGKAEVVKVAYDILLAGDDDPTPMSERATFRAIQEADDPETWGAAYAAWSLAIADRVGPLLGALLDHGPGGDPVLEELVTRIDAERRTGNESSLAGLTKRGLVPRRTAQRKHVVDVVWTLTAPEVYDRLVVQCGWSEPSFRTWLAGALAAAVRGDGITKRG